GMYLDNAATSGHFNSSNSTSVSSGWMSATVTFKWKEMQKKMKIRLEARNRQASFAHACLTISQDFGVRRRGSLGGFALRFPDDRAALAFPYDTLTKTTRAVPEGCAPPAGSAQRPGSQPPFLPC